MAALQQTPITFQYSSRVTAKLHPQNPLKLSFSGSSSFLKLPKLTVKITGKRRGGARMADSAAGSYAQALADVAKSNQTLESTAADLEKVEKLFSEPAVKEYFINPTISIEKKRELLDEFAGSSKLQPHVVNFLNILVDMKRIDLIKEILKDFWVVYNKLTDTEVAIVTSVVKLDSQHLAQIAKGVQRLTGAKNVRIKTVIDPSLVAGFTIRYGSSASKLIDMSVKKQLEEITAQLDLGDIQLAV
ncbi:ATP synthase delta chain, chloroplastic [Cornus florida]|uniref:ATP synthase delta chain, chloroplastic n=1 Tax=Cornus florida TaxID=4283 RepID=UPI00289AC86B|nr:ATP synthase delta chain, chloroplastic [Cornus florida]